MKRFCMSEPRVTYISFNSIKRDARGLNRYMQISVCLIERKPPLECKHFVSDGLKHFHGDDSEPFSSIEKPKLTVHVSQLYLGGSMLIRSGCATWGVRGGGTSTPPLVSLQLKNEFFELHCFLSWENGNAKRPIPCNLNRVGVAPPHEQASTSDVRHAHSLGHLSSHAVYWFVDSHQYIHIIKWRKTSYFSYQLISFVSLPQNKINTGRTSSAFNEEANYAFSLAAINYVPSPSTSSAGCFLLAFFLPTPPRLYEWRNN